MSEEVEKCILGSLYLLLINEAEKIGRETDRFLRIEPNRLYDKAKECKKLLDEMEALEWLGKPEYLDK